ncbi:phage tail domain-containing protein [Clostridium neonatale]|uniref:phage tail domain-containing protein n=1 Tax=Clostridium neonatale TaxID=137838 RepID=UPI00291BB920|nr:phage tail domain-containing protein [Clostridium neonatale]CAI3193080.1 Phage tail protein [Clostridium neonatale]CAI3197005.1 Phage tail protein [Clostridium neonatale]
MNRSYIFYNNINSNDLGLIIENIPEIPTSNYNYDTIEVDGGENLTIENGFSDIEFKIDFAYFAEPEEYLMKKQRIDRWLISNANKYLIYSLDEFSAYKVKKVAIDSTTTTSRSVRHFTVTFTCVGLKYLSSGLKPLVLTSSGIELNNFGTYESKPILKIYGSGNVAVNINGNSFTVKNISSYVVIDSELKECYKDSTNMGKNMTGDYPILSIGKNTISWIGNITKIELTPRWRCF